MNGYTSFEIGEKVGISRQAVERRLGDEYLIGYAPTNGRPQKLYNSTALELWKDRIPAQYEHSRKVRNDKNVARKVDPALETEFFARLKQTVFAMAQYNLKLAVERVCEELKTEGKGDLDVMYMYEKRVIRKDPYYVSPVFTENWKTRHTSAYHKDVLNKQLNAMRYSNIELGESLGWLSKGFGAGETGWAIDCRSYDARTLDASGKAVLGRAIFIRCAFTGKALWMKPVANKNETSQEVIEAILECMLHWQKTPQLFFAVDNGSGLNSERALGVMRSLLPESAFEAAERYTEIFHDGDPIINNLSHTPTSIFKASLERWFKIIKDEYDAVYYSKVFAGGTRQEAVRLSISNVPVMRKSDLVPTSVYNEQLWHWLNNAYARRPRPAMFQNIQSRIGIAPTVECVSEYYWSDARKLPSPEKLAMLLYYTARTRGRRKCKMGRVECEIDGKSYVFSHGNLAQFIGQHISVVLMPNSLLDEATATGAVGQIGLLYYTGAIEGSATGTVENPVFLGVSKNSWITSYEQLCDVRPAVNKALAITREYQYTSNENLGTIPLPALPNKPAPAQIADEVIEIEVIEAEASDEWIDYEI